MATCLAFSLSAHAQSFTLQLPAQALATSLSQVAQQAKIQLLFDEKQLKNVQAPALNGDFTAEVAIRTLLNNGAFTLIKVGSTYVVRPDEGKTTSSGAIQLDALSVIGTGNQVDSNRSVTIRVIDLLCSFILDETLFIPKSNSTTIVIIKSFGNDWSVSLC